MSENSGLKPKKQGQLEGGDPFLAKLQEIDRDIGKFEGKKHGTDPVGGELSNNIPLTSHLYPIGILNPKCKAGGIQSFLRSAVSTYMGLLFLY